MKTHNRTKSFVRALIVVVSFWWLVLALLNQLSLNVQHRGEETPLDLQLLTLSAANKPLSLLGMDFMLILLSLGWAIKVHLKSRRTTWERLKTNSHFGLHSSMGDVHHHLKSPFAAEEDQVLQEEHHLVLRDLEFSDLILNFIEKTRCTHPELAQAMCTALAKLCHHPQFPASSTQEDPMKTWGEDSQGVEPMAWHQNHHGQCTLLDHSLRVAAFSLLERTRFEYRGLHTDLSPLVAANKSFTFDAQDPLPVLIALVHDIGKLQTFQLLENHSVHRVQGHHGPVGAMLLAQLDCIKSLKMHQQQTLFKVLYHYHNPFHFHLNNLMQLEDDYTVAQMMLLVKADKKASRAERMGRLSQTDERLFEELKRC